MPIVVEQICKTRPLVVGGIQQGAALLFPPRGHHLRLPEFERTHESLLLKRCLVCLEVHRCVSLNSSLALKVSDQLWKMSVPPAVAGGTDMNSRLLRQSVKK